MGEIVGEDPKFFNDIPNFLQFLKQSKSLKTALIVNIGFYLGVTIAFLYYYFTGTLNSTIMTLDFRVFYTSIELLNTDPSALYTSPQYQLPFRYIPVFSYLFYILHLFPFEIAYILQNTISFGLYLFSTYLLYEISVRFYNVNPDNQFFKLSFFIYILAPIQVPNYILGQINIAFLTFVLLSIFFFENSRQKYSQNRLNNLWGGLMLGLAITFKPIAILFVPFLIDLTINLHGSQKIQFGWRPTFERLLGIGIILFPNLFVFAKYTNLINDFFAANFQNTLDYHQSTSITRLIMEILSFHNISFDKFSILIFITLILFVPVYFLFLISPKSTISYVAYFDFAILIVLLAYPDSWFLYLIFHLALFIPTMAQIECTFIEHEFQKSRTLAGYLTKWLIVYFVFGVICHYVLFGFDPITPSLLLIIYVSFYHLQVEFFKKQHSSHSVLIVKNEEKCAEKVSMNK